MTLSFLEYLLPLYEGFKTARSKISALLGQRRQRLRAATGGSPQTARWLVKYYAERGASADLYRMRENQRSVPFLTRPEWAGLGRLDLRFDPRWRSKVRVDDEAVSRRRSLGQKLWSDDLYCLSSIEAGETKTVLRVGVCDYLQYVTACAPLEEEATAAAVLGKRRTVLRDEFAPNLRRLQTLPLGAHGIGIGVVLAGRSPSGWEIAIQTRSASTVSNAGMLAIVPAGAYQPHFGAFVDEFSLPHQFLREYGEELLGLEELRGKDGRVRFDWFYHIPGPAKDAVDAWRAGGIRLDLLGFGFDARNCEPHLAILARVEDRRYWHRATTEFKKSWESQSIELRTLERIRGDFRAAPTKWTAYSAFSLDHAITVLSSDA